MALDIHSDIWTILRKDRTDLLDAALQAGIVLADRTDANGRSLLFRVRSAEAVRILSAHGAFFRHESNFGETALHYAADDEVVRLLIAGGADISRLTCIMPSRSALTAALREGRYKAAQALLDNGANVNPTNNNEVPPLNAAISGMPSKRGSSNACTGEGLSLLKKLLEAGADPNVNFSPSPLMLAVHRNDVAMVRLLFEYGARVNYDTLHAAVATQNDIVLEELLQKVDRKLLETPGIYTPLHAVMQRGDGEMLDGLGICKGERTASLLVDAGMPVSGSLVYARGPRTACWILEKGGDPNECGMHGHTAAHFAAAQGNAEVLKVLLEYGADISRQETLNKNTPLHFAVSNGHAACVKILLDAGAETRVLNRFGETAEELASGTEIKDMFRLENRYRRSLVLEFNDTRCFEYSDAAGKLVLRRLEQTQGGEDFYSDFRNELIIREREKVYGEDISGIATIILMHPSKPEAVTLSPPEDDIENLKQIHAWLEQPFISDAMKERIEDKEYGPCP